MTTVSNTQHLDAPAEEVWDRIGDFHGWAAWHPAIASSESLEDGQVRVMTTGDGARIVERLVDSGPQSCTYRIEDSPLPVADYESTLRVAGADAGGSDVVWEAQFEPAGASADEASAVINGIMQAGLTAL